MNKIICIHTFSGRRIYIEATQEKWRELTEGIEVCAGYMVTGWHLSQDKMTAILDQKYPEREVYKIVAIAPWRDYYEAIGLRFTANLPTPDYYIVYSSIDKPEAKQ